MDKRTKLAALLTLAKAAAEIAADIATITADATVGGTSAEDDLPVVRANLIIGTMMPAEQHVEQLQAIFRAMHALHSSRAV